MNENQTCSAAVRRGEAGGVPTPSPTVSREAVEHYVKTEWSIHLGDVMMRRSSWHYYHAAATSVAEQVATWMAELLGWSPAERQQEIARYHLEPGWSLANSTSVNTTRSPSPP